ncbi:uncharacterized protein E0L32_010046 [Thyridium curvatum]|uniref:FAD-binding FR-type domain-containing protein n=1 Tax=Thyridium curvatum TaxID=1093900 RepID=A0A507AUG2_9PEZI|nr:uncharacterized protein E0L32_010046 [Thyridium curvatum]TPX08559.1 hypothetical protein E0L32_010046 [Thyridium curvatum]
MSPSQPGLPRPPFKTTPGSAAAFARTLPRPAAMSATAIFATAALAAGAYALYVRRSAVQAEGLEGRPPFASFGFRSLKLQSADVVNHNTKRLVFELPDPAVKSGLTLTSALLTITFPGGSWLPTVRPYTPVNDLNDKGKLEFLIKHYPNGKASTYLHALKPGDAVTFAPIPGYKWRANEHAHIALVAGGQGITPCYQLARGILADAADRTRVTLVWGVNTDDDIVLGAELSDLAAQHPGRLDVVYVVSKPEAGSMHVAGHVTREVLERAGVKKGAGDVAKVFVCGPPAMEKVLVGGKGPFGGAGILAELGYGKKEVHRF